MRIASYNLQKCVGVDMRRHPARSMVVIRALRADVVVLQEADKRLPPRPTALPFDLIETKGYTIAEFGQPKGSLGWHGNAMLLRDGIEILEADKFDLPGLEPRGAIRADLQTPLGPVRVVGVHLGLIRRHRLMQLNNIAHTLDRLPNMPTVIAGDFNEWGPKHALDAVTPAFDFVNTAHSFPSPRPVAALDGFATTRDLQARDHGVLTRIPAPVASDHLPIWMDLSLREPTPEPA
ncbi:endonuclease/exonuclease/phosphatase family metal-dependent hydrolase [Shimia isoporae]|uniref:Endonuclease/exonuclease/phosphatase family metal-dependent hydrolase n=1 Tax=Shimia isoporae TaxID=647720 RepID=A0A4R1NN42_9RHOB|nr:endonuclease/exonuclease/phosphatase family protein [Shimia isoporae]TCL09605.1 endonuclease/exonuclease/phosphatase family metal-dependent hydrolase [Shimia isoporae]